MQKLPQWKCHKTVGAAHIAEMRGNGDGTHTLVLLDPHNPGATFEREVTAAYMAKHAPHVGMYFVLYEDGYESCSPTKAFEAGYTLIEEPPQQEKQA